MGGELACGHVHDHTPEITKRSRVDKIARVIGLRLFVHENLGRECNFLPYKVDTEE